MGRSGCAGGALTRPGRSAPLAAMLPTMRGIQLSRLLLYPKARAFGLRKRGLGPVVSFGHRRWSVGGEAGYQPTCLAGLGNVNKHVQPVLRGAK
jgi:hypothetical protein